MTEKAVSEAIGVILIIGLVVIGIGLIFTLIFSEPLPSKIPSTQMSIQSLYDQTTGNSDRLVQITNNGGDELVPDQIKIIVDNNPIPSSNISLIGPEQGLNPWTSPLSLGQTIIFNTPKEKEPPHNIQILYLEPNGGESQIYSAATIQKVYKLSSWGDWTEDHESPTICCVSVKNTNGNVEPCKNTDISWIASDNTAIKRAKIEFFDGSDWSILSNSKSTSPFSWTIPSKTGSNLKVRVTVTDLAGNSATNESTAFSIVDTTSPVVSVSKPESGVVWPAGSQQTVLWNSGECSNQGHVELLLSTDAGVTYPTQITAGVPDSGSYSFKVPSTATTNAKIKVIVTDSSGNVGEGTSQVFKISEDTIPTLNIIQPNGGELLTVGTSYSIKWSATDDTEIDHINIDITYDNGNSWNSIVSNWGNTGEYSWIPKNESNNARIRITAYDTFGNVNTKLGANSFSIQPGSGLLVTILSPNGGEILYPANVQIIRWSVKDSESTDQVTIEYSTQNGADGSWKTIGTVTGITQYSWTIPCAISNSVRIKVSVSRSGSSSFDISDGSFTISSSQSTLNVISPNGGETLYGGDICEIKWSGSSSCDITGVSISFSSDGGSSWSSTISGIANTGTYQWTVPNIITTQGKIKVSLTTTDGSIIEDTSDTAFEIRNSIPVVRVISPKGAERWETGSQQSITWNATDTDGIAAVSLYYSINNGLTWTAIASGITNSETYAWTLPSVTSTQALVKIIAVDKFGNQGSAQSDSVFTITNGAPKVTVITPNGGNSYTTGSSVQITWTASDYDGIDSWNIAYSINDNPFTFAITSGTGSGGSYTWSVPSTPSDKVRIIVTATDTLGKKGSDESDAYFSIVDVEKPTISISKPISGATFRAYDSSYQTTPYQIVWTATDNVNVARIYLEYSSDSGASYKPIIDNLSNNGYYYWYVPKDYSTTCIVRATAYDDAGNSNSAVSPIFRITY